MLKKIYLGVGIALMSVLLSGCFGDKEEEVTDLGELSGEAISFAKGMSDVSFSSSDYSEMSAYVSGGREYITDIAFDERFDFSKVEVMNMFRDEGAVQDYEIVETFVETDKSRGYHNVVVVSKVNYLFVPVDGETLGTDGDLHDHSEIVLPRTVVDIYRFEGDQVVEFERL